MQNNFNFNCPNCNSTTFIGKTSIGKKFLNGPYKDVNSETQCANVYGYTIKFMENINKNNLDDTRKLWSDIYKPAHKLMLQDVQM